VALSWVHSFGIDEDVAEYLARGWFSTTSTNTITDSTTADALSAPPNGVLPGDTHVLECRNGAEMRTPPYLGLGAGATDRGCWCFRVRWASGNGTLDRGMFVLADDLGAPALSIRSAFTGLGTLLQIDSVQGTRQLIVGNSYSIAIVYDYTLATPTIDVYVDGELDISTTDTAPKTIAAFGLRSHDAVLGFNTLRFYSDPVGDLAAARQTNTWMLVRRPANIDDLDIGWSQIGAPASDLDAIQSDLATGLERLDAGQIIVSFEEPEMLWDVAVQGVAVAAIGASSTLQATITADDPGGQLASDTDLTVGAYVWPQAIALGNSAGDPLSLGGTQGSATLDYTSTFSFGP